MSKYFTNQVFHILPYHFYFIYLHSKFCKMKNPFKAEFDDFEKRYPEFLRLQNELDTPKFRQDSRRSSNVSLVISLIAVAIAFASLMVSIFK